MAATVSEAPARSSRAVRWVRWVGVLAIAGALVGLLIVNRVSTLTTLAHWLDVGETPTKTDFVLPLSGDPDTRPFAASALCKADFASKVLISRVAQSPAQAAARLPAPHDITQQILVQTGIPSEQIHVLQRPHRNTFEEALALKDFLISHPQATVTVVTNNFHTRRSRWAFNQVLGERKQDVHFVSVPSSDFDETNWWKFDEGFATYTMEFLKLGYYYVRYGDAIGWVALVAVSLMVVSRRAPQLLREP